MMKKNYIAPSLQVLNLDEEMPVLCGSIGSASNNQPTHDNKANLFSVDNGGWNAAHWAPAEDEDED